MSQTDPNLDRFAPAVTSYDLLTLHLDPYYHLLHHWVDEIFRNSVESVERDKDPCPINSVIDFGCGTGTTTEILSRYDNIRCLAIDESQKMIAVMKKRFGSNSQVSILQGNEETLLSLPAYSQDIVFSVLTLHNMPKERRRIFFKGCKHVLKPSTERRKTGVLIADKILPSYMPLQDRLWKEWMYHFEALRSIDMAAYEYWINHEENEDRPNILTEDELESCWREFGFTPCLLPIQGMGVYQIHTAWNI